MKSKIPSYKEDIGPSDWILWRGEPRQYGKVSHEIKDWHAPMKLKDSYLRRATECPKGKDTQ